MIRSDWEEMFYNDHEVYFRALSIPDIDSFSNPSLCSNKIAYWVDSEGERVLRVFDLETRLLEKHDNYSYSPIAGDMAQTYPYAKWSDRCGAFDVIWEAEVEN